MNMASLTVYGDDLTLRTIREALPTDPASDWRKGDARDNGRTYLDSGFRVDIAHIEDPVELLDRVRVYLTECGSRGISFDVPRIVAELQISLRGGIAEQAANLDMSVDDLNILVSMGVCLSLAAA